jgi:hypothetical protein
MLGHLSMFRSEERFRRNLKTVHDFIDSYVWRALASFKAEEGTDSEGKRYVFLQELAKYTPDPVLL